MSLHLQEAQQTPSIIYQKRQFNIVLEALAGESMQEKEIKGI